MLGLPSPFPPSRRHGAGRSIFLAALLGERAETANVLRRINPVVRSIMGSLQDRRR